MFRPTSKAYASNKADVRLQYNDPTAIIWTSRGDILGPLLQDTCSVGILDTTQGETYTTSRVSLSSKQMDNSESPTNSRQPSEADVDRRLKQSSDAAEVLRLCFLKYYLRGNSIKEAAEFVGRSQSTGYRWKADWEAGGIDGMMPEKSPGRTDDLSDTQKVEIRERVREIQPCTIDQLETLLETEFDCSYTRRHLKQKLPEMGITYTKPAFEVAKEQNTLEDSIWEQTSSTKPTKRHPYNEQKGRMMARWSLSDDHR